MMGFYPILVDRRHFNVAELLKSGMPNGFLKIVEKIRVTGIDITTGSFEYEFVTGTAVFHSHVEDKGIRQFYLKPRSL